MKEDLACKIPTLCAPCQALSHLRILGGAHGGGDGGRAAGRGHLPLSHVLFCVLCFDPGGLEEL